MIKIPHKGGCHNVPLINQGEDFGLLHNGGSMRMIVRGGDDSKSLFLKELDFFKKVLGSIAPHRETIGKMRVKYSKIEGA
jgi:hypothetical protein